MAVEKNQKWTFLYALIITLFIFNVGVFMGYKLESHRLESVNQMYTESEMGLLDQQVQKEAFDIIDLDCDAAIQANIDFADKIFEEAQKIQKIEDANRINGEVIIQHKRFDLLRTLFWINSIKIKEKCNAEYTNVVYFYEFEDPSVEQKAEQKVFSNFLEQIKQEYGNNVMLIPIAADEELPAIKLLLNRYNIDKLPSVLIDEKITLEQIDSVEDIRKYIN